MRKVTTYLTLGTFILATFVLGAGYWLEQTVEKQLVAGLQEDLTTLRDSNVATLREWMKSQERIATLTANEPEAREAAVALIEVAEQGQLKPEALFFHPLQETLREIVAPTIQYWEFKEFVLLANDVVVASARQKDLGRVLRPEARGQLERMEGEGSILGRPQFHEDWEGDRKVAMWVASPIFDRLGHMRGAFAFRIDPREAFTKLLQTSQYGVSGETYAFDLQGLMLSGSRFEPQLRKVGLLGKDEASPLRIQVREPGLDLSREGATALRKEGPLTEAVRGVIALSESGEASQEGHNTSGYFGYRGVPVVGAWTWLPDYEFGVTTEIDQAEAYASLSAIQNGTRALFLILVVSAFSLVVASGVISRLQKRAERGERLGQYTLLRKLGEGGMGAVYEARHALLRRPTAIKVIRPENIDSRTRQRFEREVQATAQLCHPNTIAVYDYGRTSAGVFYYAMEFLAGIDLHNLVAKDGPLPENRVRYILEQVLGSIAEAHEHGMVHRDIKPPNIMVCRRGGIADLVKVLDFGLVKDVRADDGFTMENALTGTPHYMAPEAITETDRVDGRTDLYAVGAVGYFLLAGRQLFNGPTAMAVLTKQISDSPPQPSLDSRYPVSAGFEAFLMTCLEKDQANRPASAQEALSTLRHLPQEGEPWTQEDAQKWWDDHQDLHTQPQSVVESLVPTVEIDVSGRESLVRPSEAPFT